jgi:hypothetical protein
MATTREELISQFDEAMLNIHKRSWDELHYPATIFFQMLTDHGGLQTARKLIHNPNVQYGYTTFWELGRLDLTVEAVIHDHPKWYPLFTEEELGICEQRLTEYDYLPKL